MGGEAAKERRRLKRLEVQSAVPSPSGGKPGTTPGADAKLTSAGENSGAPTPSNESKGDARPRLQQKSHAQTRTPTFHRGNTPSGERTGTRQPPFRRNDRQQPFRRNDTVKHKTRPAKKPTKAKKPKPKHLQRKMDQVAKAMVDGANVADVEGQMKQLLEQMEQYKKSKQRSGLRAEAGAEEEVVTVKDETEEQGGVMDAVGKGGKEVRATEKEDEKSTPSDGSQEEVRTKKDNTAENGGVVEDVGKGGKEAEAAEKEDEESDVSSPGAEEPSPASVDPTDKPAVSSSSSDSSDDDSGDEDDIVEPSNARSRGKRRRGRQEIPPKEQSLKENPPKEQSLTEKTPDDARSQSAKKGPTLAAEEGISEVKGDAVSKKEPTKDEEVSKKTPKKEDNRRCIGRKPVTDFALGELYSGRVKYIKPKLGAFIDIGCHSDAFCHISCVSNHFVASVADVLKVDDVVENARVVEINKEKKRVTVSLRSEEMAENERKRLKTTRRYEKGLQRATGEGGGAVAHKKRPAAPRRAGGADAPATARSVSRSTRNGESPTTPTPTPSEAVRNGEAEPEARSDPGSRREVDGRGGERHGAARAQGGQDLKRERKLARRAERRAALEAAERGAP